MRVLIYKRMNACMIDESSDEELSKYMNKYK